MKLEIIPRINDLSRTKELVKKYDLGLEYNDFFMPDTLDDEKKVKELINEYKKIETYRTIHGVFFDICFNSSDNLIKEVSYKRAYQVLEIAKELNCKKIVFHTNYIVGFKTPFYINSWVDLNAKAYNEFLNKYPDIEIDIENMFDENDEMILKLLKKVNNKRFRMCLDVAHASLKDEALEDWFNNCKDYISHIHLNDNFKDIDSHLPIGKGRIDYKYVISKINSLKDVTVLIEVNNIDDTIESLNYLLEGGLDVK